MTDQAKSQDQAGPIDLGREADFRLGTLWVRPSTCEVQSGSRREIIQPRAMQVLVALARAGSAVVSRDRLIELCWEGRVVGEDAINRAVAKVRIVAEIAAPAAFEVETIPRIGFRLKVREPSPEATEPGSAAAMKASNRRARSPVAAIVIAASLVLVGLGLFLLHVREERLVTVANKRSETSIAVLPFVNMSGDKAKDYFSDGFSEELLNDLSNTSQLRVAARTSSFSFKGRNADIRDIARKLGVHNVLEGSVRESGDRVRITAQLIDASSGYHLWSRTYDRKLTDILKVQSEIAEAITAALSRKLLPQPAGTVVASSIDPEAYRKFLLGKSYFDRGTSADNDRAVALFREVTVLQPDFSDGYAMLAYAVLRKNANSNVPIVFDALIDAALARTLALDPANTTALIVSLNLALAKQDWDGAARFVARMQGIAPRNVTVARASGLYYQALGFPDRSIAAFDLATKLDPLSPSAWGSLAIMDTIAGRNKEAVAAGETALAFSPQNPAVLAWVCIAHAALGEIGEARMLAARVARTPEGSQLKGCEQEIARATGDLATARRIVEDRARKNAGDPSYIGQDYLLVGEYKKALPWLKRAYDAGDTSLYTLPFDPVTPRDFLRTPGWIALTQQPRFRAWQAAHDQAVRLHARNR